MQLTSNAISPDDGTRHRLRDRLWLGGFGVLLFLVTLAAGTYLVNPSQWFLSGTPGMDLMPSYMAGKFVRDGRPDLLMDYPAAVQFQARLRKAEGLEQHGRTGPWLNPPFYAWLFVPLAGMSFRSALWAWLAVNLTLLSASAIMLCRMLPRSAGGWRRWGLVPLLMAGSFPFIQTMASQQNTFLSLCILTAAVTLWRGGRALPAGMVAGLLLFKPQLAVIVAAVMFATLGRRALLGFLFTGGLLLLVTLITLPGTIGDYLYKLPTVLPWLKAGQRYAWERQITFQGFWRLWIQGSVSGPAPKLVQWLWPPFAIVAGGVLIGAVIRVVRGRGGEASRDRLIAITVASIPLLMPYYMDYDLLLLAVPAVLFAADWCRAPASATRLDRATLAGWFVLFPWLYLNAAIGDATRISITVPLLAGLWGMLIARAWQTNREIVAVDHSTSASWAKAA
jgi:hypothetical protein